MGITGVPFGRTEVLVPPKQPHERALAQGKAPRGPGIINSFGKQCKQVFFLSFHFLNWFNLLGLGSYRFPVNPRIGF